MDSSSSVSSPAAFAKSSGEGSASPGQLLQALSAAFFNGGGWVEPLTWDDWDETGHAKWESMAEVIGRNVLAASVAPELLAALRALRERVYSRTPGAHWPLFVDVVELADAAVAMALPAPRPDPQVES